MNEQREKGGKGNFTEDRQRSTEQGRKGGQGQGSGNPNEQRPADQGRKGGQGQGSGGERNR